jgi:protoheme IX farnesyltransferase
MAMLRDLVALTKPRITLMVILTTAGGLWLAPGEVAGLTIVLTLLATAMVVGAANTLNCWLERDVDKHMARTKHRPLPDGRLQPRHALMLGLSLGAISVPVLTLVANPLTGLLAALALVSYVWVYTPMKQKSPAALIVGAVPGALPPLMGWTAVTGELAAPGIVLFGILFLWQMPHFLAIAMFRQQEYTKAGIKVMPAVRGNAAAKLHAVLYAGALIPVSLLLVPLGIAGSLYLAVAGLLGLAFFAYALVGLRAEAGNRWARQLFFVSLVYLPLLFAALAIDVAALR